MRPPGTTKTGPGDRISPPAGAQVLSSAEDSPSGLWRSLGKRVGLTALRGSNPLSSAILVELGPRGTRVGPRGAAHGRAAQLNGSDAAVPQRVAEAEPVRCRDGDRTTAGRRRRRGRPRRRVGCTVPWATRCSAMLSCRIAMAAPGRGARARPRRTPAGRAGRRPPAGSSAARAARRTAGAAGPACGPARTGRTRPPSDPSRSAAAGRAGSRGGRGRPRSGGATFQAPVDR